jgi:hypothetical protein
MALGLRSYIRKDLLKCGAMGIRTPDLFHAMDARPV